MILSPGTFMKRGMADRVLAAMAARIHADPENDGHFTWPPVM